MNVGVLASGTGTNLQALIDRAHGTDGIRLAGVASDKPEATASEMQHCATARAEISTPAARAASRKARALRRE